MDIQWTILYIVMVCTLQPRTNINYITFLFTTVVQNNFLTAGFITADSCTFTNCVPRHPSFVKIISLTKQQQLNTTCPSQVFLNKEPCPFQITTMFF
ncbi:hypothetical protein NP493_8668g00000 [Ridgeia piscesae]|uniref:Uncharacterized protein n=1 Tax=Ridgeia piscesae TaxID=27915 RepID=A0AAD9MJ88_RIDPI|nr:hypothetical protein NP493_8668g00000 [Ridgeia piscesae]